VSWLVNDLFVSIKGAKIRPLDV